MENNPIEKGVAEKYQEFIETPFGKLCLEMQDKTGLYTKNMVELIFASGFVEGGKVAMQKSLEILKGEKYDVGK